MGLKITKHLINEIFGFLNEVFGGEELVDGIYFDEEIMDGALPSDYYIYYNLKHRLYLTPDDVDLDAGMTKIVLFPPNKNYVIKIPCDGLYRQEDFEYSPIVSACALSNIIDEEMATYDNVKEWYKDDVNEILAKVLVPNYFICNYGNIPIYIQPLIKNFVPSECSSIHHSIIDKIDENNSDFEYEWIDNLINQYGIEKTSKLLSYLYDDFDDLHSSNYGYLNGNAVIFDYGGYSSEMWDWI